MIDILDTVAATRHSSYTPLSPDEFLTLRLARGLGEPEAAAHYAVLTSGYSRSQILGAYRASMGGTDRPARAFHNQMSSLSARDEDVRSEGRLLSIRVTRRFVCVALFSDTHLEGWRLRHLSSDSSEAKATIKAFLTEVLAQHPCSSAAIEADTGDAGRSFLQKASVEQLRSLGISVRDVPEDVLIAAFAHPAPKSRKAMREIVRRVWPMEDDATKQASPLDAFALGLYVQTERLFDPAF